MIPYHKQETKYTCGAASFRMVLESLGIKKTEKEIGKLLGTNKIRGTWHKAFPIIAEKYKLNYVVQRKGSVADLKNLLKQGYKIIICYFYPPENLDHYSILKKIDARYIYFLDPWFGENHKYPISHFKKIWKSDPKFEKEKGWCLGVKK